MVTKSDRDLAISVLDRYIENGKEEGVREYNSRECTESKSSIESSGRSKSNNEERGLRDSKYFVQYDKTV